MVLYLLRMDLWWRKRRSKAWHRTRNKVRRHSGPVGMSTLSDSEEQTGTLQETCRQRRPRRNKRVLTLNHFYNHSPLYFFSIRIYSPQCILITETANLRKSRNANREPLHPRFIRLSRTREARWKRFKSCLFWRIPLLAARPSHAICESRRLEAKAGRRHAASVEQLGWIGLRLSRGFSLEDRAWPQGMRIAFLDLRRFAVSLAIYADQFNHLYFR